MSKHTPGPWFVDKRASTAVKGIIKGSEYTIAGCGGPSGINIELEELQANARLIATAPELLEALRDLVEACAFKENFEYKPESKALSAAYTAIEKAEGKK